MMNNAKPPRAVTLGALLLAASLAFGCESEKRDMPDVTPPENQAQIRSHTAAEFDTLRALKERHGITRDEYWDDRGGVLANDIFEVWYPPGKLTVSHGLHVFDHAMRCRRQIAQMIGRAPEGKLTIVCTQTMDAYTDFTGREWWHYSNIEDDRIIFQPVAVLYGRGILDIAVPRELYEWAFRRLTKGNAPLWLVEGMASWLAAEDAILEDNLGEFPNDPVKMKPDDMEAALRADNVRKVARFAYYNAYMMVKRLDQEFGQDALAAMLRAIADGDRVDDAARSAFELPYDELLERAQDWTLPSKETE